MKNDYDGLDRFQITRQIKHHALLFNQSQINELSTGSIKRSLNSAYIQVYTYIRAPRPYVYKYM